MGNLMEMLMEKAFPDDARSVKRLSHPALVGAGPRLCNEREVVYLPRPHICLIITAAVFLHRLVNSWPCCESRLPSDQFVEKPARRFITHTLRVHCKELLLKVSRNADEEERQTNFSLKSIFFLKIWLISCHNNDRPLPNEFTLEAKKKYLSIFSVLACVSRIDGQGRTWFDETICYDYDCWRHYD